MNPTGQATAVEGDVRVRLEEVVGYAVIVDHINLPGKRHQGVAIAVSTGDDTGPYLLIAHDPGQPIYIQIERDERTAGARTWAGFAEHIDPRTIAEVAVGLLLAVTVRP